MSVHLGRLLAQRADLTPDREALVSPTGRWTFTQFDARCNRLANYMLAQGVAEGDRVAVYSKNSEFLACALFAVAKAGATLVVLNWRLQAPELSYILADSEPAALLFEDAFAPTVRQLVADRPGLILINKGTEQAPGAYERITADTGLDAPLLLGRGGDAPAVIMYTSGTTGKPKGALLSHAALIWTAQSNSATLEWNQDHRFLLIAPMFHIGGLSPMLTNVFKGCTTVLLPDFDPTQVWEVIARERITSLMTVPVMLQALLALAKKQEVDSSSLVSVTCGASAVPLRLIEDCLAIGVKVQQVYGITEFCGAVTFWTHEMGLAHAHSHGKVLMFGEVRIVDPSSLEPLAPGLDGEVWCRGPMMFSGYWRNPQATQAAIQKGWYRTGDIGRIDEHGFLHVVDRLKDMIISGGENIYPAELEAVIASLPGVAEVAVIGQPDERWGEVPVAFVVAASPGATSEAAIIEACRLRLAGFKCVKSVQMIDTLPRSSVGKVLKRQLFA
ncbi:O-succinylbenzoate-CoA ligase [Pseudomonas sp. GM33]|uniref:o-succinylbenzoate--CoA ligase n=1 Tax=Pseudomonas sp. GM33 TaxID=1144329 RepID=UPI0002700A3A|nr:o-succinylbenzoate--CoA ligase [Pseudomonas sp. GM33]EJM47205.1 O-succinylbenzoate-CoA ligase [Pseudomonas sp. GM33]MDP9656055.1 O-succinylbenzoate-CoA ligase [Pseudomonas putida]